MRLGGCSDGAAEQEVILTAIAAVLAFAERRRKHVTIIVARFATVSRPSDMDAARGIALALVVSTAMWLGILSLLSLIM
jgi:hypothetical protein